ncbi:MAG: hypothetical protein C3F16_11855 [Betaproteobacteria bacterium]|nr:MAG: hypothetical protein C3F16_11855 [Betaproteobacteria bacterium]
MHEKTSLLDPDGGAEPVPVTLPSLVAVMAFAAISLGFHASMGWVPLLDSANLALHEAGHPLVGILSNRLAVYGGTLFQLAFPVAVALHFHRRDHAVGAAAGAVWLGENLLNVARYMADARVQQLPLVGGGDHDWAEIFTRWHLINADTKVAGLTRILAVGLMAWAVWWLYRRWQLARGR